MRACSGFEGLITFVDKQCFDISENLPHLERANSISQVFGCKLIETVSGQNPSNIPVGRALNLEEPSSKKRRKRSRTKGDSNTANKKEEEDEEMDSQHSQDLDRARPTWEDIIIAYSTIPRYQVTQSPVISINGKFSKATFFFIGTEVLISCTTVNVLCKQIGFLYFSKFA